MPLGFGPLWWVIWTQPEGRQNNAGTVAHRSNQTSPSGHERYKRAVRCFFGRALCPDQPVRTWKRPDLVMVRTPGRHHHGSSSSISEVGPCMDQVATMPGDQPVRYGLASSRTLVWSVLLVEQLQRRHGQPAHTRHRDLVEQHGMAAKPPQTRGIIRHGSRRGRACLPAWWWWYLPVDLDGRALLGTAAAQHDAACRTNHPPSTTDTGRHGT